MYQISEKDLLLKRQQMQDRMYTYIHTYIKKIRARVPDFRERSFIETSANASANFGGSSGGHVWKSPQRH